MAGDTMRFRNPAGHAGLLHNLVALVGTLAGFLESRAALFAKESKTALVQVLILVACLGRRWYWHFLDIYSCWRAGSRGLRMHYINRGLGSRSGRRGSIFCWRLFASSSRAAA